MLTTCIGNRTCLTTLLLASHGAVLGFGFALGIYMLPILIAPQAPASEPMLQAASEARYTTSFSRQRQDSDFFHWGEGTVAVGDRQIAHQGELAPGPDYRLYLSPRFIETEADFENHRQSMKHIAHIKTFDGFLVDLPQTINIDDYNTVVVWCETFGEFITSAQYRT